MIVVVIWPRYWPEGSSDVLSQTAVALRLLWQVNTLVIQPLDSINVFIK